MINTKQKVYLSVSKKKKAFESKEIRWQQQLAEELHKPMLRDFTRRRVIVNQIDEIWSADLVDMQNYLLTVIDVFSKYGWIKKKGETETKAFKTIFKEGRQPQCVWIDKGKEFYNKHLKEFLDKHDITINSTENEENSNVVERWNRTIKQRMWKQSKVRGNTK